MKKQVSMFALLLSVAAVNFSCSQVDNAVQDDGKTAIELDGQTYRVGSVATFAGTPGTEVSLTLGVYDDFDIYGVDFGDGQIVTDTVGTQNKGVAENGAEKAGTTHTGATKFTGIVAGEGIIKVYGNSDVWYLLTSGGAAPTSFDQEKLKKVVQVSITGADIAEVVLPQLDSLKQFSFNNSPVQKVDVSKAKALTSLTINSTTASGFEPQLQSIDVSQNTELTYLSLQGNNKTSGKLTTIDLTKNAKLESVYLQYNQLKEVKLAANYDKLTVLNAQNNQLTEFDATKTQAMKSLYLADNLLTKIDVSKCKNLAWLDVKNNQLEGDLDLTANLKFTNVYVNNNQLTSVKVTDVTKQFYFDQNQMTLATIPAKPASMNTASKTKQYHYAPQAALKVPAEVVELDLSDQLTAVGIETEAKTTVYSFVTASGTELAAGTDYEVTAPGKFKFIKAQSEKVHGVLSNEALPLFTGDNAFVTTEFTVK